MKIWKQCLYDNNTQLVIGSEPTNINSSVYMATHTICHFFNTPLINVNFLAPILNPDIIFNTGDATPWVQSNHNQAEELIIFI